MISSGRVLIEVLSILMGKMYFLLPYGKQTWEFSVGTYQSVKGFIDSQVESSETE